MNGSVVESEVRKGETCLIFLYYFLNTSLSGFPYTGCSDISVPTENGR